MDVSRISRTGPASPVGKSSGAKNAGGSNFSSLLAVEETEGAAPVAPMGAVGGVGALLMAQEAGDAMEGRRKNKERAAQMLDKMEQLRLSILEGRVPGAQLRALNQMVAQERTQMDDPALHQILDDIELRLAVELAKLGVEI